MSRFSPEYLRSLYTRPVSELSDAELRVRIGKTGLCLVDALVSVAEKRAGRTISRPIGLIRQRVDTLFKIDREDAVITEEEKSNFFRQDVRRGLERAARICGGVWQEMWGSLGFRRITAPEELLALLEQGKAIIIDGFWGGVPQSGNHCYHVISRKDDYFGIPTIIRNDGEMTIEAFRKELDYLQSRSVNSAVFF